MKKYQTEFRLKVVMRFLAGDGGAKLLAWQCSPKGKDLGINSQEQLDAIADEINNRPRNGWG